MSFGVAMGLKFASGFLQGIAESRAARAQAKIYDAEAQSYRANAAMTRRNGAVNEDIMRASNRAYMANSRAAAGEAGMGESATFQNAAALSVAGLEQNVLFSRYQTETEAENYIYQARVAEENARVARKHGRHQFRNSLINGATSALSVMPA